MDSGGVRGIVEKGAEWRSVVGFVRTRCSVRGIGCWTRPAPCHQVRTISVSAPSDGLGGEGVRG